MSQIVFLRRTPFSKGALLGALFLCGGFEKLRERRWDWTKPLQDVDDRNNDRNFRFARALFQYALCESNKIDDSFSEEEYQHALQCADKSRGFERKPGMKTLMDKMLDEFELRGKIEGKIEGEIKGKRSCITDWLIEDYGPDANELIDRIETIDDVDVLDRIHRLMRRACALEEIERGVDSLLESR